MTNQALPNLKAAIDARRAELADIPRDVLVAWANLQDALNVRRAEQHYRQFANTEPAVHSPVVDMAAVRSRAEKVRAENAAWLQERGLS